MRIVRLQGFVLPYFKRLMMFPKPKRKNKFNARKKELAGRTFDSKGEANLYLYLLADPEITNIKQQVSVYLTKARILYKPDFSYEKDGELIYAEYKGFPTPIWRIKRRLWIHYGPGKLEVYMGNCQLQEIIGPGC